MGGALDEELLFENVIDEERLLFALLLELLEGQFEVELELPPPLPPFLTPHSVVVGEPPCMEHNGLGTAPK